MTTYVYIDGDNICMNKYIDEMLPTVKNIIGDSKFETTVICQSNIIFKYNKSLELSLNFKCCRTKNKNATDCRIIYYCGMHSLKQEKVIIISNDRIYEEIEESHIIVLKFPILRKENVVKFSKRNMISAIEKIKMEQPASYDITLSDIQPYFPTHTLLDIRRYIESLHCVHISGADAVYVKRI